MLLRAPAESTSRVVDFPVCLRLWFANQKCLIAETTFEGVPGGIKTWKLFKTHIDKLLLPNEFLPWPWNCIIVTGKTQRLCLIKTILLSLFSHPTFIHKDVFSPGVMQCLEPACSSPFCFSKRLCNSLIIRHCCVKNTFSENQRADFWPVSENCDSHFGKGSRHLFCRGDLSCESPC